MSYLRLDCLKPDAKGGMPECKPNGSVPCCIGLECVENPKVPGEFRCGNPIELKISGGNGFGAPGGGYDQTKSWNPVAKNFAYSENPESRHPSYAFSSLVITSFILTVLFVTFRKWFRSY